MEPTAAIKRRLSAPTDKKSAPAPLAALKAAAPDGSGFAALHFCHYDLLT